MNTRIAFDGPVAAPDPFRDTAIASRPLTVIRLDRLQVIDQIRELISVGFGCENLCWI